jgi:hypothetical protein
MINSLNSKNNNNELARLLLLNPAVDGHLVIGLVVQDHVVPLLSFVRGLEVLW